MGRGESRTLFIFLRTAIFLRNMTKVHVENGSLGRISFYSATEIAKEHRGWPLGAFITDENNLPLTEEFEVKLMHYKVGDRRDEWTAPSLGIMFHIVLSGAQRLLFAPNGIEEAPIERVVRA